jgi:hypothetical protein
MLLIYEITEFAEKDLRPVQRYVQVKIHVEDWRWHFRFNSEWWRKCVRMLAPKARVLKQQIGVRFAVLSKQQQLGT